ncbi:hypothetical protein FACS189487_02380 [Campylobacterota bacterium]|nr:hypothetical protein FACS189487_02380 [Campylobacterota bacterium]
MKRLLAALVWVVIAAELCVFFVPKRELYFAAERELEKLQVSISGEKASDLGWYFSINGGSIIYDRAKIAENGSASLIATIFFNRVKVESLTLSNNLASVAPKRIDSLEAIHTIFVPHKVFLSGEGEIGEISGTIDLLDRKISLLINAPTQIQQKYGQLFAGLEKTAEGFLYESNF